MLKESTLNKITQLIQRYPALEVCRASLIGSVEALARSYLAGGKVIVCGNGGSASDAEHIVGELMKGFIKKRPLSQELQEKIHTAAPKEADYICNSLQMTIPAISLMNAVALNSAFANDQAPDLAMDQQLLGLGKKEDVLLAISTSGNSTNVIYAIQLAKALGITTIGLTGNRTCYMQEICDILISVPEIETYKIQELHLPVYHTLCMAVEEEFFQK